MKSYSLLTKTYRGDLEAFEQLCDSIDRFMPALRHYVLVDRADMALFARFRSPRRILVDCGDLLPRLYEFHAMGKRMWWRPVRRIVRGWIYQQLAKIQFVASLGEDAVVLVDSDALFVRPIRDEHVFAGDQVRLFHNPGMPSGPASQSEQWHNLSLRAFGLPETGYTGFDYISQAVIWSPAVVSAMIARIEEVSGRNWIDVLLENFRFSEYVLYGVFAEQVDGPHRRLLAATDIELSHCSWHYDLDSPAGIDRFVAAMSEDQVAVLIQSNLNLADAKRAEIMRRFKEQVQPAPGPG